MPGFYMSNLGSMLRPNPVSEAHEYTLALPMPSSTQIPLFDAAGDTGKYIKAMAMKREQVLGKRVLAATAYYSPDDIIKAFQEVKPNAGKGAHFFETPKEVYKGFLAQAGMPEFVQEELYENMAFMNEFGYFGKAELAESLAVSGHPLLFRIAPFRERRLINSI